MAQKPFVVIGADILTSSIWSAPANVRLVWITLLILCDTEGYVGASLPGIARAAGVDLDEAKEAMAQLQQPDPYSRTKENEGRRVEPADRGWQILNFKAHIDRLSVERHRTRERVRRWRNHGWKGGDASIPKPSVGDLCPCCQKTFPTPLKTYVVLDHDHSTGRGRAYICRSCNSLVGRAENGKPADQFVWDYISQFSETGGNGNVTETCVGNREKGKEKRENTSTDISQPAKPPNPIFASEGGREAWVKRCFDALEELKTLTGEDGSVLFAEAQSYEGAKRRKLSPWDMTEERLMNTVLDLEASVETERKKAARKEVTW